MSRSLAEQCTALAWSQWVALGVSGRAPEPRIAVELEAAIVFAPELAFIDPRLHDEALDWCVQFAGLFVSVSVLKRVARLFDEDARERFERFAATVNAFAGTKWPASGKADLTFKPSNKSKCRIDRSSSVALRARKIFGINARADILVGLALEQPSPEPHWTRVSSFSDLGYTKRALSTALGDLRAGGLLDTLRIGNTVRYALRDAAPLRQMLAPLPQTRSQPWGHRLALAASLLTARRLSEGKSQTTAAVEIHKTFLRRAKLMETLELSVPDVDIRNPWRSIERWIEPLLVP